MHGSVISDADGDAVTVLDTANQQHRAKLAGVDALERDQPFADQSREYLAQWIHGQDVIVDWHKRTQYARLVGVVKAAGIKPN